MDVLIHTYNSQIDTIVKTAGFGIARIAGLDRWKVTNSCTTKTCNILQQMDDSK
jgi:hypothetical protein